jgi:hypothetical protein
MLAVVDSQGEVQLLLPDDAELASYDLAGMTVRAATDADMPPPGPKSLRASQILNLFTITERARARRLLTATWPAGHPLAGDLIDPEANMQVLLDTLIARGNEPLPLDSSFFTQGAALFLGLGLFDGATPAEKQARAARVLAGELPDG